ncbi:hypothetical protein G9A89_007610 [Geosiphon pyriformis]|nr:hypothetical protein G9A89_007610 [Geosiphon pyriformis]
MLGRDGRSKGHGIVLYATVADAQKAMATFDGYEWHGRRLEVREDRSAMDFPPPPPRSEGANSLMKNEIENENLSSSNGTINTSSSSIVNDISVNGNSSTQASSPIEFPSENISIGNGTSNGTYTLDESSTSTITNTNASSMTTVAGLNGVGGNIQRQLFVGNLPFRVRWQDLKDLFRKAGTVIRADVAMGYDNRSKGHGTVLFATLEDAKNAIAMFHNYNWQSRTLEVREDRGFVDPNNGTGSNFFPEITRRVHEQVLNQHSQNPFAPGAPMIAPGIYYGPRGIQTPAPNYAGRLLFVGNLPFNCQWQDLKDLFRNAGNIIRADVSTNYDGRSRGFGTVLFATPEDARNAVVMYNNREYQGRTLRVHFDKFALPSIPPLPHHPGPHIHLVQPVHPHHRPPLPLIPPHNFHMGLAPSMHHPHFLPSAHMGPFSPPLTTPPPLTSPPPYPATAYNISLNHLASTVANASTNGSTPFQQMTMVSSAPSHGSNIQHSASNSTSQTLNPSQDQSLSAPSLVQFSSFGPIGKNHSVQTVNNSSSTSSFGSVSAFPNPISGVNNNGNSSTGNNNAENALGVSKNESPIIQSLISMAGLHVNPNPPQPLFYHHHHHPHLSHHPHHRPPVVSSAAYHHAHAFAAVHHHQQQQQHQHQHHHALQHQHPHPQTNHTHHPHHHHHHHHHHHPGAIGSGIVGGNHLHQHLPHNIPYNSQVSSNSSVSVAGANGLHNNSSSTGITDAEKGKNGSSLGTTASVPNDTGNSNNNSSGNNSNNTSISSPPLIVPSAAIWNNNATNMLSGTSNSVINGGISTSGVMSIEMATLAAIGPVIPTAVPQSVFNQRSRASITVQEWVRWGVNSRISQVCEMNTI